MHDGAIVFKSKIDNSNVEKDLKDLKKKIHSSEDSISKNENAKLPLVKQAEQLEAKLNAAKRDLAYIQQEMAAVQAASVPGSDPADYMAASADYERVKAALDSQEKEVQDLQKTWDNVNDQIDAYDRKINASRADIQRYTEEVGKLRLNLGKGGNSLSDVFNKAEKSANKFGKRIISIGMSVFVFNLLSSGLRMAVQYIDKSLQTNKKYTAQLSQLKGALLTAFQPIYEFISPAIIYLMQLLTLAAQTVGRFFAALSGKSYREMQKNAEAMYKQANGIGAVGAAAKEAKKQLMGFDELNKLNSQDTDSGGPASSAQQPTFGDFDDTLVKGKLDDILRVVGAIAAALLTWKISSLFMTSLGSAAGMAMTVGGAVMYATSWADAFANGIDWGNLSGMLLGMLAIAGGLALVFGPVGAAVGLLVTSIGLAVLAIKEWIETGELSNEGCAAIVIAIMGIGAALALLTGSWIPAVIAAIAAFIFAAVTKGDELKAGFGKVMQWFRDTFLRDWRQVFGEDLGGILNTFLYSVHGLIESAEQIFGGLIDFVQGVFTGNWEQAWSGLVNIVKGSVNWIISIINGMIAVVVSGINALFKLLSFNIELPNGESIGWNLPQFQAPQIPYLAQGAVLPPNKPFLAMVGDQKHGTNIEAPLETIEQALRNVMMEQGMDVNIEFRGELAALARILTPVITKEQRRNSRSGGY